MNPFPLPTVNDPKSPNYPLIRSVPGHLSRSYSLASHISTVQIGGKLPGPPDFCREDVQTTQRAARRPPFYQIAQPTERSDQGRQHQEGYDDKGQADRQHDQHRAVEEALPRFHGIELGLTGGPSVHDQISIPAANQRDTGQRGSRSG